MDSDVAALVTDDLLPAGIDLEGQISDLAGSAEQNSQSASDHVYDFFERVTLLNSQDSALGLTRTGFAAIDEICLPSAPALMLLVGRPGSGRSAFLHHLLLHQAQAGGEARLYTLDLPAHQVTLRLLTALSSVQSLQVRLGRLNELAFNCLAKAAGIMAELPLSIVDDFDLSVDNIAGDLRSRAAVAPGTPGGLPLRPLMVGIDGLELMGLAPGAEVTAALVALRRLSRELGCVIVLTFPVSDSVDRRPNHRPLPDDLSFCPEGFGVADAVLGLYRDEMYNPETTQPGVLEVSVLRNQSGPTTSRIESPYTDVRMKRVRLGFQVATSAITDHVPEL